MDESLITAMIVGLCFAIPIICIACVWVVVYIIDWRRYRA